MVREPGSEPEGCTMWPWVLLWLQETSYGWCSARLFQGLGFLKCDIRCLLFSYTSDPLCLSVCVCFCAYFRISDDNSTTQPLFLQTAWNPSPSNLRWLSVYYKIWIWTTSKEFICLLIYSPWSQTQFQFMGCFMYCGCQDSFSVINEISRLDIWRFHRRGPSGFSAVINSCKKWKPEL